MNDGECEIDKFFMTNLADDEFADLCFALGLELDEVVRASVMSDLISPDFNACPFADNGEADDQQRAGH